MATRFLATRLKAGCALSCLTMLAACGGGAATGVSSTPAPPAALAQAPTPPPLPAPSPPSALTSTNFNTSEYARSNGAAQARAITAYEAGATGAGVTAAVIDSGVGVTNSQFAGRISAASADLAGNRGIGDDAGHGTFVADILLGARNGSGIHGVAFDATLLVARTDTPGSCTTNAANDGCSHNDNAIARGVDLAVANNARVINISLGGSPANNTLRNAINRATAAGIVIVISAGNKGVDNPTAALNPDTLAQIANDGVARNLVIIAGALDASNTALADFSNRAGNSSTHYLGALGVRVRASDQNEASFLVSGTSFSAPVISGAVALLASAFPTLNGSQIVDLLFRSANDLGAAGVDSEFGYGALNIARAFQPQGQLSIPGVGKTLSLASSGTLSTAMGDATKAGLRTVILDEYARAFDADLSPSLRTARRGATLGRALGLDARTVSTGAGPVAVSLSLSPGRDDVTINRLLLAPQDREQARAVAGSIIARLSPNTDVALGFAQSGAALADQLGGDGHAAFLASRSASDGFGFDARGETGFALRHRLGRFAFSAIGDTGIVREVGDSVTPLGANRYQSAGIALDADFGALKVGARATRLREQATVLGARFTGVIGAGGAESLFVDANARLALGQLWTVGGTVRQGWTRIGPSGVRRGNDRLRSASYAAEVNRTHLFTSHDQFTVRVAQPLRVTAGGFDLTLPSDYDYATGTATYGTQRLNLTPEGHERVIESVYARALGRGYLTTNLYWRTQPDNIAAAPADFGAAVRFRLGI
ncbi:MAG: S8 family peptidase [Sphingomonadaceae bacterium]